VEKKEHHNLQWLSAGISKGFRTLCGTVFAVAAIALIGCLDIPDEPTESTALEQLDIYVFQEGTADSTLLKVRPTDSSIVRASTYPRHLQSTLTCRWLQVKKDSNLVMGEGFEYTIPADAKSSDIPNAVEVTDVVGNTFLKEFKIVVNQKPTLDSITEPTSGDTLYGNRNTSIRFKWRSYDSDSFDENSLVHTLIIDSTSYSVGHLTEIMQSGFSEGAHTFQVIVADSFGDADTLPEKTFYMVDTLGGSR
jgi:hypothetical protein